MLRKQVWLVLFTLFFSTSTFAGLIVENFDVHANNNVWNEGQGGDNILNGDPGLATGILLELGDVFSAEVTNIADTWNFCSPSSTCTVNADGIRSNGTTHGVYTDASFSANYGALVGRIGLGDFFAIGTAGFSGAANAIGELKLYHWDHNNNNSGTINVNVTTSYDVPEPSSFMLMILAASIGVFARRKKVQLSV